MNAGCDRAGPVPVRELVTAEGMPACRSFRGGLRPSGGAVAPVPPSLNCGRQRSVTPVMRPNSGFTLIEVMVTVAIVAILAAIAVPSYNEYVQRARITEATSNLADMRNKMEQYFQDNRTWTPGGGVTLPCNPGTVAPMPTSQNFTFTCDNMAANAYRVVATGNAGSSVANFVYTINQFNQRTSAFPVSSGWTPKPNCWVLKKDGSC
jgi:type IV pilus assembly protein PilE